MEREKLPLPPFVEKVREVLDMYVRLVSIRHANPLKIGLATRDGGRLYFTVPPKSSHGKLKWSCTTSGSMIYRSYRVEPPKPHHYHHQQGFGINVVKPLVELGLLDKNTFEKYKDWWHQVQEAYEDARHVKEREATVEGLRRQGYRITPPVKKVAVKRAAKTVRRK